MELSLQLIAKSKPRSTPAYVGGNAQYELKVIVMAGIRIIKNKISRQELQEIAEELFGDFVKAVVDIESGIIAIGGELHSDEEAVLLEQGAKQENLWGINLYPQEIKEKLIEFDSVINIRPAQRNRSRDVQDPKIREKIVQIVNALID